MALTMLSTRDWVSSSDSETELTSPESSSTDVFVSVMPAEASSIEPALAAAVSSTSAILELSSSTDEVSASTVSGSTLGCSLSDYKASTSVLIFVTSVSRLVSCSLRVSTPRPSTVPVSSSSWVLRAAIDSSWLLWSSSSPFTDASTSSTAVLLVSSSILA